MVDWVASARLAVGTGHRRPLVERQNGHLLGLEVRAQVADLGEGHQDHSAGVGESEAELKKHPVTVEVQDEATGQMMEQVVGYRLDTELSIYEQEKPIRCVVEWDGKAGSKSGLHRPGNLGG